MTVATCIPFADWLRRRIADGPLSAEETVHAMVPLLRQVLAVHEHGHVAPLVGLRSLQVAEGQIFFSAADAPAPRRQVDAIARIERAEAAAVEIRDRQILDDAEGARSRMIGRPDETPTGPVFLPGYLAWEHAVEHHDPLTDVFSLGLILASLGLGLDLADDEDLERFVAARTNPFAIHPRIHPVLARCIVRMTEPVRARRLPDLAEAATLLAHHREQAVGAWPLDLGLASDAPRSRRQRIQERLRDRLFDCSRRNRLLHYRATQAHCNLTVGSVPVQLDVGGIRSDDLCTWGGAFAEAILAGKPVNLGRWLRHEDAPWVPGTLERIRAEERRDRAEFGASQLRLVAAFLRWNDLKEAKDERIASPLLLLPVVLERRKGVRDAWTLTAPGSIAEVNPALRHLLRLRYGLDLPESIDLAETPVAAFHARLQETIQASEPGVTVRLVDRPRIDLVLQKARARTDHHRRRARMTGKGIRRHDDIDYSYDRDNFQPLGLQTFLRRVKPGPLPIALVGGDGTAPQRPWMVQPGVGSDGDQGAVRSRETFILCEDADANPYAWELDCCNVTLGNFNYRKMTLVRDYRALLERDTEHPGFDAVFAERPRPSGDAPAETDPTALWGVVPSDPTQDAAVARAHAGGSYVIQGPPGTGKSQTITNLIADQVARGRRVLFVCAKRAALDVVHHRLAKRGLDRLCCLIHDSQEDKKPFIADLRSQYEAWLAAADGTAALRAERDRCLADLRASAAPLERYATAMATVIDRDGLGLRALFGRLVALADRPVPADAAALDALPGYGVWMRHGAAVASLAASLRQAGRPAAFAACGLRHVDPVLFRGERPVQAITAAIARCRTALAEARRVLDGRGGDAVLPHLPPLSAEAGRLGLLASRRLHRLVASDDPGHAALRADLARLADLAAAAAATKEKTAHWIDPIPEGDCAAVLEQVRGCERGLLRVLKPAWWRLRRILGARYRFAAHVVPPAWSTVVSDLMAWYAARRSLAEAERVAAATWGGGDLQAVADAAAAVQVPAAPVMDGLRRDCREGRLDGPALAALAGSGAALDELLAAGGALLGGGASTVTLDGLEARCADIERDAPVLAHALPALRDLVEAPGPLWSALRERPWDPETLEAAILRGSITAAERRDGSVAALDGTALADAAQRLRRLHRDLLGLNARLILAESQARFAERAARSVRPGAPDAGEREWRKRYARGRRELEHEFAKVMRHRSIRDLADDETGLVISDLKPIWLMSPLSVSDTLPLDGAGFDLVVFDEASQIPVEEAVPALYRAPQAVVVGDRQQLPPSDFFASGGAGGDEEPDADDLDIALRAALEHDSFLTQAAANLQGTMLGWHYRSRSEALIAFSNAAFYDGRLLTIPDAALPHGHGPIAIGDPPEPDPARVLERPLSFHRLPASPYVDRRNPGEAAYIAKLLRGLLAAAPELSIGIVAFSEAQQGEIEAAVSRLAGDDPAFRERLDAAAVREDDGQFNGLFIKNLENVQGDERDLVIMSVCYGPDPGGRMIMNFGPINQSGGEKRLNVVFSRARRHLALVTSITADRITNDFNPGAAALKRYLAYAEAASAGSHAEAARILAGLSGTGRTADADADPHAEQVADALRAEGWQVDRRIGASRFRCDIAVRGTGDAVYRLGILLDHERDYAGLSCWERDVARPAALHAFGWRIEHVLIRDWIRDRDGVLHRLRMALAAGREPAAEHAPSG
ncbi:MAG: hypothetical protein RLZZ127_270 [Planctomycetota bacterium]|jgi:hypothetical protein